MTIPKKKIDDVYDYIARCCSTESIINAINNGDSVGVTAYNIESELGITRNNASTLLNSLHASGRLIKIKGKPVEFIASSLLDQLLINFNSTSRDKEFTRDSFARIIFGGERVEVDDPFEVLIGAGNSLSAPINRAKAAMIYPPNGLHTLLLGASGVGKTTFAQCMHLYALHEKKVTENELPFVHFNCSDYYTNPQLLLSQLFGHVKGAFSGAERTKEGLVTKADGGILFLDEIHRLSSDGQEMLFSLMDTGTYSRLGDASTKYRCNVLLVAATTEDPQQVLLKTFLRRIPVTITLPGIQEKPHEERLKIIEFLFKCEAIRTDKSILVTKDVLRALLVYKCKGNIGQLKSDIKLICARSFLERSAEDSQLVIEYQYLPRGIKDQIHAYSPAIEEVEDFVSNIENLIVTPDDLEMHVSVSGIESRLHDKLKNILSAGDDDGLSKAQMNDLVSMEITEYYKNVINRYNYAHYNIREFYKIVDKNIVDFTYKSIMQCEKNLNVKFKDNLIFGLSIHIHTLIHRIGAGEVIRNDQIVNIKNESRRFFTESEKIVIEINSKFGLDVPIDEIGFICVILTSNLAEELEEKKIGLILISHGESTATSMANVCNRLLNTNHIHALDMPLEMTFEEFYPKVKQLVKSTDKGKGVIILVDMGSINNMGPKITEETGINIKTFEGVSTPLALEVLRLVLYKNESLHDFKLPRLIGSDDSKMQQVDVEKKPVVLSVCVTGIGASQLIEAKVKTYIEESCEYDVDVISISLSEIKDNGLLYQKILKKYMIIGCVGTIDPEINYPFIPVEKLFSGVGNVSLSKMLAKLGDVENNDTLFEKSISILGDYVMFINPKLAVRFIKEFVLKIIDSNVDITSSRVLKLSIHICCMLERVILGNAAIYENLDKYKQDNEQLFKIFSEHITILETPFDISISDDEIAYMLKVLNTSPGDQ